MKTTPKPDAVLDAMRPVLPADLMDRVGAFDPAPRLTKLSSQGPIHRIEHNGEQLWLVTSHEVARTLLADPRMSADRYKVKRLRDKLHPEMREKFVDSGSRTGAFITTDPPDHTRYRRLLARQFTMRRMRTLTERIEQIVAERLDVMIAAGPPADLIRDFALPVPSLVICELLGVPTPDRAHFQGDTIELLDMATDLEGLIEVGTRMHRYMRDLVRHKRDRPEDDLLSELAATGAMSDDELVGLANLLLIAGHETTTNMLGLGVLALLEHPEQLRALRDDPQGLMGTAVEEMLRYLSIIDTGIVRYALAEVHVGEVTIHEGDTVMCSVIAANRDAAECPDPGEFRVDRPRTRHLSFGHGVHQCLGNELARVEMSVSFRELLRRLPGLRLAVPAEHVRVRTTSTIFGVKRLPVTWDS
ncbi:cytochrome P450 [Lentzea sp. NPDC102401]|uniref:cytochrome P450 n=1 Tax=Lentzea sp. NPDC102401 TaxID=3364128 RepID=UPI0038273DB6